MSAIRFSEEQAMLLDTATGFFRSRSPTAKVREQLATEAGFDDAVWQAMIELGWTGLAVPEADGGSGLGLAEAVAVVEPMGRYLNAAPLLDALLAAHALGAGGSEQQRQAWLPKLAAGAIVSVATSEPGGSWDVFRPAARAERSGDGVRLAGSKSFALHAERAELLLVSVMLDDAPALALVTPERLPTGALRRETVVDQTQRSYAVALDGIELDASEVLTGAEARAALAALRDGALLLYAALACGGLAGVLELTVEYLNVRTQFGRPIGSFQALKHPTVDVLVGLERARSLLYHAATAMAEAPGADGTLQALRMAKAQAGAAFAFGGDRSIQFHGAFGFTYECDAQLYLRRALWCEARHGDARHQRERLAAELL